MFATGRQKEYGANSLLAVLPDRPYQAMAEELKLVHLKAGQVVYESFSSITHCYFPLDALVSLMSVTEQGASVAVAIVGKEGVLGGAALIEAHLLPYGMVVQCSGNALKIPAESLKAWFVAHQGLRSLIFRYAHALFTQIVQTAACNRFHTTEQRLIRCLLLARDRLDRDTLPFTHECLSLLIGTDRVSVTRAALGLKKAGLIDYHRGKTIIIDFNRLSSAGCECYSVIYPQYEEFLTS